MRKKKKERKKKFKALELSTTVVRLELLSAFVLRLEAYGYVICSFFNQRNFPENSSIGCRSPFGMRDHIAFGQP